MKAGDKKTIKAFEDQKEKLKSVDFTNYSIWVSTTDDLIKKYLGETSSQRVGLLNLFDTAPFDPKDHDALIKQRIKTAETLIDDCIAAYKYNLPDALSDFQIIQSLIKRCHKIPNDPDIYESDFTFSGKPDKRNRFLTTHQYIEDLKRDLRAYILVKMAGRAEYLKICDEISFEMPFKTIAPEVVPLEFYQYKANNEHWGLSKGILLNLLRDIEAEAKMGLGSQAVKIVETEKMGALEIVKKYSLSGAILTITVGSIFQLGRMVEANFIHEDLELSEKNIEKLQLRYNSLLKDSILMSAMIDSLTNSNNNNAANNPKSEAKNENK